MRRRVNFLLLIAAFAMSACEPISVDKEVDWYPVNLRICVRNSAGEDILNPSHPDFYATNVVAEWCGKTYTYTHTNGNSSESEMSRVYMPKWYGLDLQERDGGYYLTLGELAGDREYDDDLIITWPDGKRDVIHYKNRVNEILVKATRRYSLNGKSCDNPIVITR